MSVAPVLRMCTTTVLCRLGQHAYFYLMPFRNSDHIRRKWSCMLATTNPIASNPCIRTVEQLSFIPQMNKLPSHFVYSDYLSLYRTIKVYSTPHYRTEKHRKENTYRCTTVPRIVTKKGLD